MFGFLDPFSIGIGERKDEISAEERKNTMGLFRFVRRLLGSGNRISMGHPENLRCCPIAQPQSLLAHLLFPRWDWQAAHEANESSDHRLVTTGFGGLNGLTLFMLIEGMGLHETCAN